MKLGRVKLVGSTEITTLSDRKQRSFSNLKSQPFSLDSNQTISPIKSKIRNWLLTTTTRNNTKNKQNQTRDSRAMPDPDTPRQSPISPKLDN